MTNAWTLYEATAPNGKRYIGVTSLALSKRASLHRSEARRGSRVLFHKALSKYGSDVVFRPLVIGEREYILDLERRAIDAFCTMDRRYGYNLIDGGQSAPSLNPDVAAKIAAAKRGKRLSAEHRAAISAAQIGRDNSKQVAAFVAYRTGRPLSAEHRTKIGAANAIANKGKTLSPEAIAKRTASVTGRRMSPETKAKIGAANAIAQRGKVQNSETKEKRSEIMRRIWAARKKSYVMRMIVK